MTQTETLKDNLRAVLFKSPEKIRKEFSLCGVQIEIQNPLVGEMLPYTQGGINEDGTPNNRKMSIINFLIDFAYVPNTNDKLFNEADREQLAQLPYDVTIQDIYNYLIEVFTGISVEKAVKNLKETSSNKTA